MKVCFNCKWYLKGECQALHVVGFDTYHTPLLGAADVGSFSSDPAAYLQAPQVDKDGDVVCGHWESVAE